MKIRRTFIIRWITAPERQAERGKSVIDVEFVQTGEKTIVATLAEAHEWMTRIGLTPFAGEESSPSES